MTFPGSAQRLSSESGLRRAWGDSLSEKAMLREECRCTAGKWTKPSVFSAQKACRCPVQGTSRLNLMLKWLKINCRWAKICLGFPAYKTEYELLDIWKVITEVERSENTHTFFLFKTNTQYFRHLEWEFQIRVIGGGGLGRRSRCFFLSSRNPG